MAETKDIKDTKDTKNGNLEAVNTTINASIASLMDACNFLRDIPRLVAQNQQLVSEVNTLREKLSKYEPATEAAPETK